MKLPPDLRQKEEKRNMEEEEEEWRRWKSSIVLSLAPLVQLLSFDYYYWDMNFFFMYIGNIIFSRYYFSCHKMGVSLRRREATFVGREGFQVTIY